MPSYKININMIKKKKKSLVTESDVDESSQLQLTKRKNIWFNQFKLINISQNMKL